MLTQSFWECKHANGSIKTKCLNQSLFTTQWTVSTVHHVSVLRRNVWWKEMYTLHDAKLSYILQVQKWPLSKTTAACDEPKQWLLVRVWNLNVLLLFEWTTECQLQSTNEWMKKRLLWVRPQSFLVYRLHTFHQHFSQARRTDCVVLLLKMPFGSFTVRPDHTETSLYAWWWISASRA